MEQLIERLNDTSNRPSPDEVREIERSIQSIQRESSGWRVGVDLLASEHPLVRFYGALTLTIKINADWCVFYILFYHSRIPLGAAFAYSFSSILSSLAALVFGPGYLLHTASSPTCTHPTRPQSFSSISVDTVLGLSYLVPPLFWEQGGVYDALLCLSFCTICTRLGLILKLKHCMFSLQANFAPGTRTTLRRTTTSANSFVSNLSAVMLVSQTFQTCRSSSASFARHSWRTLPSQLLDGNFPFVRFLPRCSSMVQRHSPLISPSTASLK